jgi:O-antigen biosynthesis protein
MKIAFILIAPDISGGVLVIFQHATFLKKNGHDVSFISEAEFDKSRMNWYPDSLDLNWTTFEKAKNDQYDLVIATWWGTTYDLYRINSKKYVYFVQSIETRFYPEDQQAMRKFVDSTYTLDLGIITAPTWITRHLKDNFARKSYLVKNGIHKNTFKLEGEAHAPREKGKLRVLVEGPLDFFPFKNVDKAIRLARESNADEVWLMTSSQRDSYPGVDRIFCKVPFAETPKIYRSCDVIVKLSYIEGMFGPPLEMFHCGGTAIVYDVTGHEEYIKHEENAYVVKKDDDEKVVNYLNLLKANIDELDRLKKGAIETANEWRNWDISSQEFMESLQSILDNDLTESKATLEAKSIFFKDWYNKHSAVENYHRIVEKSIFTRLKTKVKAIPFFGRISQRVSGRVHKLFAK